MRIDMKRQAELNQRKGLSRRTALSIVWFVLCLLCAYFFTGWLVNNGPLDSELILETLSLPPELGVLVVRGVAIILIVGTLQFLAVVVLAMMNPAARARTGQPTATPDSVDYYEQQYSRRA